MKVWDGDQKRLFKKYPEEREECMAEIVQALERLQDDPALLKL